MSLVNDMLRDLDQRRNGIESTSEAINLRPAMDYSAENRSNYLPFILAGLIIAAVFLGYYWAQLDQTNSSQQRDVRIRPAVALLDKKSMAADVPNAAAATVATTEPAAANDVAEELVGENPDSANPEDAPMTSTAAAVALPGDEHLEESRAAAVSSVQRVASEESSPLQEGYEQAQVENPSPGEASANLLNVSVEESVKEPVVLSEEQQDIAVVQDALRLIANNKTDDAYGKLEAYIIENRFAHRARETFALMLMREGRTQEAGALVDAGLVIAPNHAGFKKAKARLLLDNGQIETAAELLLRRAPEITDDQEYHEILAIAQFASRNYAGASISYAGLVRQDQSQGKWWYGYAAAEDSLGNRGTARQAYNQAIGRQNLSANLRRRSQDRLNALSL